MNTVISAEERDKILKNLVIPPRPSVLDNLLQLRDDPNLNLQRLGTVIESDMALSAAVLKAANSPVIAHSRRISAVAQAISILGVKNVVGLVSGLVLKSRLSGGTPPSIEQFWDRAMTITMICKALCEHLGQTPEQTPSFALFHNCGIALMLMRYANYERTLQLIEMAPDEKVSRVEHELHGTSHDVVGYLVGRAWNMPEAFCQAILLQFDKNVYDPSSELPIGPDERLSIALARAATNVWRTLDPGNSDAGWGDREEAILGLIGISPEEFDDWRDNMHGRLTGN